MCQNVTISRGGAQRHKPHISHHLVCPPSQFHCSCCNSTASRNVLRSCSNPLFEFLGSPSKNEICPSPPKLSYTAASAQQPQGLLESQNVYVAELLLQEAQRLTPEVFFRRFQAGFSLTVREPSHTVCGCSVPEAVCTNSPYITALADTGGNMNVSRYSFNQFCALSWSSFFLNRTCSMVWDVINRISGCAALNFSGVPGPELQCNDSSSPSPLRAYRVDGLSSDVLQVLSQKSQLFLLRG